MTKSEAGPFAVERFLARAQGMTVAEWVTVAQRFVATEETIRASFVDVAELGRLKFSGRIPVTGATTDEYRQLVKQANQRAMSITALLPETIRVEGREFRLRWAATEAIWHAMRVFLVHGELMTSAEGREAAQVLLTPFEGFASTA